MSVETITIYRTSDGTVFDEYKKAITYDEGAEALLKKENEATGYLNSTNYLLAARFLNKEMNKIVCLYHEPYEEYMICIWNCAKDSESLGDWEGMPRYFSEMNDAEETQNEKAYKFFNELKK